ncbi:MAG TPA: Lrp/AsnC family transcriptional regulator [Ornithinimicrobium sp.]|uniref:Lrp/AsnC family transcriptional regulator n=1 Tax=Ornithinimicrobium sp. TaxID=1977084 RepID=UPI002B48C463|nr:Lrp/AsnC family transcriptional regulator [Ornithinimicrobium sp.]HKJ12750.1 Lrp/AsnC family transcriptional regulator [Ornithinimicrobium sp.]
MQGTTTIDELDLALVAALMASPRAPWTRVAAAVGVSASAASRRWQRLAEEQLAWTTAHPGKHFTDWGVFAVASLRCDVDRITSAADELADDPMAITVEVMSGATDIEVTIATATWAEYTAYLLTRLPGIEGVRAVDSMVVTRIHREGSEWRPGALDAAQRNRLPTEEGVTAEAPPMDGVDIVLCQALGEDARMSLEVLAQRCGTSPSSVTRRIRRLVGHGVLALRCDLAAPQWAWPVQARVRGHLSSESRSGPLRTEDTTEVRLAVSGTGEHGMHATVWLRRVVELPDVEQRLCAAWPGFVVGDRSLTLRTLKRMGNRLGADGRREGYQGLLTWEGYLD